VHALGLAVDLVFVVFFFFSSRRRHTRFSRDWSSDVCSSDLAAAPSSSFRRPQSGSIPTKSASCSYHALSRKARASAAQYGFPDRSEERRVGKECSSGWRAQPEKQQKTRGVRETRRRTTGECA